MKLKEISISMLLFSPLFILMILARMFMDQNTFPFYVLFGIVLVHGLITKGWKATLYFQLFAFLFSLGVEYLGETQGFLFGKYHYVDGSQLGFKLFGEVPICIPVTWTVLLYLGIEVVNIIMNRHDSQFGYGQDPLHAGSAVKNLFDKLGLSTLVGFVVMIWDVSMDPLAVAINFYTWESTGWGLFFGIPLTNFFGWWVVAAVTGVVYYIMIEPVARSYRKNPYPVLKYLETKTAFAFKMHPVMLYSFFFLGIFKITLVTGLHEIAFINIVVMFPVLLITFLKALKIPRPVVPLQGREGEGGGGSKGGGKGES
ncbi:MAG: carotenoid biosynthesis protein [Promethearchaeota archaeon]